MIHKLKQFTDRGIPIIVLEPSCLSNLSDDYLDLMENQEVCRQVIENISSLEDFLTVEEVWEKLNQCTGKGPKQLLFHGHCQQTALSGTANSLKALSALKQTNIQVIDSGCCGMAGSFGYEKTHYDISKKIGERRLLPAVRKAATYTEIIASGFSCRSQIKHFTDRRPSHLAEVLARSLRLNN